eukprot:3818234-Rhodomonas_salina.1
MHTSISLLRSRPTAPSLFRSCTRVSCHSRPHLTAPITSTRISLLRSCTTASHSSDPAQEHPVTHDRISLLQSLATALHSSDRAQAPLTPLIVRNRISLFLTLPIILILTSLRASAVAAL